MDFPLHVQSFLQGIYDVLNYQAFLKRASSHLPIIYFIGAFVCVVCAVFLPAATYLDSRWNAEILSEKQKASGIAMIQTFSSELLFQIFVFLPWSLVLIGVTAFSSKQLAKITRKGSPDVSHDKSDDEKSKSTGKHGIVVSLLIIIRGVSATIGMVLQNVLIPKIPLVGSIVGLFVTTIYSAMLSFSANFSLIPKPTLLSTESLPASKEPLDIYKFVGMNWPYFLGFAFPGKFVSLLLMRFPYAQQLFTNTLSLVSVVMAFNVTESLEVPQKGPINAAEAEAAPSSHPRFTRAGQAPFPLPLDVFPRLVSSAIVSLCNTAIGLLEKNGEKSEEKES